MLRNVALTTREFWIRWERAPLLAVSRNVNPAFGGLIRSAPSQHGAVLVHLLCLYLCGCGGSEVLGEGVSRVQAEYTFSTASRGIRHVGVHITDCGDVSVAHEGLICEKIHDDGSGATARVGSSETSRLSDALAQAMKGGWRDLRAKYSPQDVMKPGVWFGSSTTSDVYVYIDSGAGAIPVALMDIHNMSGKHLSVLYDKRDLRDMSLVIVTAAAILRAGECSVCTSAAVELSYAATALDTK